MRKLAEQKDPAAETAGSFCIPISLNFRSSYRIPVRISASADDWGTDKNKSWNGQKSASGEELGVDYIDGFQLKHYRERRTIPIGTDGNDGEIEMVYEYWYAPDLKLNILSKRDDPRTGAQSARLKDIRRGEPIASLFEIPPGYEVLAVEKMERPAP